MSTDPVATDDPALTVSEATAPLQVVLVGMSALEAAENLQAFMRRIGEIVRRLL